VRAGAVSVVVNGDGTADKAWRAIGDLELPGTGHEVIIVTTDSSRAPAVVGALPARAVRVPDTASVGRWRDAGAAAARGEYVAFLADGAVPDSRWVCGALDEFRADARLAAVVAVPDRSDVGVRPVLYGSPGGLVVETRAYHWVGGAGSESATAAADVDLCWRLWRAGMAVAEVAASVVNAPPDDDSEAGAPAVVARIVAAASSASPDPTMVRVNELAPLLRDAALPAPRVLVVTPDVLTAQMAGPAIRAYELAAVLHSAADIGAVELVSTVRCDREGSGFAIGAVDGDALRAAVSRADIVVIQGHVLDQHPWLAITDRVLVVDAYDPIQLEALEQSRDLPGYQRRVAVQLARETVARLLERGDCFLVASPKQRDLLIGQLTVAGRVNPTTYDGDKALRAMIGVVPFGIPDARPHTSRRALRGVVPGIGPDDAVVLWGGGVYNWFDPITLIHAVDQLRARVPEVRLFFMGMRHPHPDVPEMAMAVRARALAHELDLVDTYVFFNDGWVPYDERIAYLLDADVGVTTHLDHVETEFSYRTRILDYLWATLPVVTTAGDAMSDLIATRCFGRVVPPGDVAALADALFALLADGEANQACRDAIDAARLELVWSTVARDLIAMCERPRRAPDLVDPRERALRGDRAAAAVWGTGWRHSAAGAVEHVRRREWNELARKTRARWAGRGR
jgi:glycosyltransferase involved in cell wall biosynthesis